MKRFLEAGRLNSPRGVRGEVRFSCFCDSPEFLSGIKKLYLDAEGSRFLEISVYRPSVPSIAFKGYEDRTTASSLVGRTVWFDRNDIDLPEGVCYNDDLLGLDVFLPTGVRIGKLLEIEEGVRCNYYLVGDDDAHPDWRIPAVPEHILRVSPDDGITVAGTEGLEADE